MPEAELMDEEIAEEVEECPIREAFDLGVQEELDEDSIKLKMIGAGASFKNVTRSYNEFMIDAGMSISKQDRNDLLAECMEDRDVTTEDEFMSAVEDVAASIKATTPRSAMALIRAFCKKNEIDCYSKPKGEGLRSSFVSKYHSWLVDNLTATKDAVLDYIHGRNGHEETSPNVKKHEAHFLNSYNLVQAVKANIEG